MAYRNAAFRFFDLPQELRDHVYSYLTDECRYSDTIIAGCKAQYSKVIIDNIPRISLLLTSKQLASEYRKSLPKSQTLTLYDPSSFLVGRVHLPQTLPRNWLSLTDVVAAFPVYCGWAFDEAAHQEHDACETMQRIWDQVTSLRRHVLDKLPKLNSVRFQLSLVWQCPEHYQWPRHYHNESLKITLDWMVESTPKMEACDIVLHDENEDWIEQDHYLQPAAFKRDAWASWSRDGGWQAGKAAKYPFPKLQSG